MTPTSPTSRKQEQRERARQWLKQNGFTMTTAEALLTALMKMTDKQIDTLRRMVEQTKGN